MSIMPDHLVTLPSEAPFKKPTDVKKPGHYLGWVKQRTVRDDKLNGQIEKNVPLMYLKDGKWKRPMGFGGAYEVNVDDIIQVQEGDWEIR
jgi:hypothetical protein